MISNASEAAIDQIVANCNGDIRGALKALLLVNERLEAELAEFYAAVGLDGMARGSNAVMLVPSISTAVSRCNATPSNTWLAAMAVRAPLIGSASPSADGAAD